MNIPRNTPPAARVQGIVRNIIPAKKNNGNNEYIIDKNSIIPSKSDKINRATSIEAFIALFNIDNPLNGVILNAEENPALKPKPPAAANLKVTARFWIMLKIRLIPAKYMT